jgi:hypothetical protein
MATSFHSAAEWFSGMRSVMVGSLLNFRDIHDVMARKRPSNRI